MLHKNKYIWRRIVAFCDGTEQKFDEVRQTFFSVCKQWRNEFKLHLWVHPTSAYCKALEKHKYRLANKIWDFSSECIDCRSESVVETVFSSGTPIHMNRVIARHDFDPSCCNNRAIRSASVQGYVAVVRLLLQDRRVDPSACNNAAIVCATKFCGGRTEVIKLLLQDERVDPSACDNWLILWASRYGHVDVVQLLLKDSRVDSSDRNNAAIRLASTNGHVDVVKLLLQDPRIDPAADNNEAIQLAKRYGHTEVVKLLSQDHRANP